MGLGAAATFIVAALSLMALRCSAGHASRFSPSGNCEVKMEVWGGGVWLAIPCFAPLHGT